MAEHDENEQQHDEPAVEAAPVRRKRTVKDNGDVTEDVPAEVNQEDHVRADVRLDEERHADQRERNQVKPQAYEGDLEELKAAGVPAQLVDGNDPDAELIA